MKKIKFTCAPCGAKLRVPTHLAGVSAPCPKCGAMITAPSDVTQAVDDSEGSVRTKARPRTVATARVVEPRTAEPRVQTRREQTAVLAPPPPATMPEAPAMSVPQAKSLPAPVLPSPPVAEEPPAPAPAPAPVVVPQILAPVMAETDSPTVFFTPPPPVLPEVASEPEEVGLSDAPQPLEDDADIVVEEHFFEETEPLPQAPITRPIHVTTVLRDPIVVPPSYHAAGEQLPRLDLTRAEMDRPAPTVTTPVPTGRTKLVLPMPGSVVNLKQPEDFLVHPAPLPMEPDIADLSEPPVTEEELADDLSDPFLDEEILEPAVDEDFGDEEEEPESVEEVAPRSYVTIPIPPAEEPIPLEELGNDGDLYEPGLEFDSFVENPYAATDLDLEPLESLEPETESLEDFEDREGELVEMAPVEETSTVSLQSKPLPGLGRRRTLVGDEAADQPLSEGSFGKLFADQGGAPAPEAASSVAPVVRGDALDDLFDEPLDPAEAEARRRKMKIALIASVVVVAVVTIVAFILVVISFGGGFNPKEAYAQKGEEVASEQPKVAKPRIPTSVETASTATALIEDAPAIVDPVAIPKAGDAPAEEPPATGRKPTAASAFNQSIDAALGETPKPLPAGGSVIGAPALDWLESSPTSISASSGQNGESPSAPQPSNPAGSAAVAPLLAPTAAPDAPAMAADLPDPAPRVAVKDPNYNPPASFAAPGPNDAKLGKTHDLIDAFLRAPDPETRLRYTYQGESLRATVEDYYKKWPYADFGRFSLQLYQLETDESIGGPYWVFIVSTSDKEDGFPLIVRKEDGLLKVDWEIFAEFSDRHYLRFREGKMAPPQTLRVIMERFSDYYGSDREQFTDLDKYHVYQVNPPYGDLNEFSEFVFVERDSEVGKNLAKLIALGEEPLAVIAKFDQKTFPHGARHFVVTELVSEGWFR